MSERTRRPRPRASPPSSDRSESDASHRARPPRPASRASSRGSTSASPASAPPASASAPPHSNGGPVSARKAPHREPRKKGKPRSFKLPKEYTSIEWGDDAVGDAAAQSSAIAGGRAGRVTFADGAVFEGSFDEATASGEGRVFRDGLLVCEGIFDGRRLVEGFSTKTGWIKGAYTKQIEEDLRQERAERAAIVEGAIEEGRRKAHHKEQELVRQVHRLERSLKGQGGGKADAAQLASELHDERLKSSRLLARLQTVQEQEVSAGKGGGHLEKHRVETLKALVGAEEEEHDEATDVIIAEVKTMKSKSSRGWCGNCNRKLPRAGQMTGFCSDECRNTGRYVKT